ncbi:PREDICTED: uncharacterized protein LOC107328000 [Acropora digitifera]|uniref:uncharacterized protein LOC107328000 n=1 Tax=Acropora digitifera TaxID=70779 RepID=UPI00077A1735|nr:PREDICTED: uncharacterized protein LOC107328000 [Acropora digitifera]
MMMASNVCSLQEHDASYGSSKLQVTILASEWGSSKGGLSTLNRELAIQLAKFSCIEVTFFLPKCSDKDKEAADSHGISVLEAKRRPGYDELDWLSFPPEHLKIDVVVGHGVKLGRQAQVIRDSHKCKWVQIVHTDPEELGMFKCYENPISTGEKKHHIEVELCQMADFVVGVGPKLAEAFRKYLGFCKKHEDVFELTPGVFEDFSSVQQVPDERRECSVLVFGRGDLEDFKLKGFDIAAKSVADLSETVLVFVGAPHGKHEEIAKRLVEFGIPEKRLRVRGYMEREALKQLFCEVDLVLMPSRTEGFGLTGLEVLSAGLPVIISKNSGFGQALGSVPFGSFFVIDSEDASAWPRTTEGILKKDRKLRLHEAKALRGFYSERYSWSKQCKGLIEKMVTLVDGTSSEPEITAQAIEAKEQKGNEDLVGIQGLSSCVPPKRKRGIEKNETEQPAARTSCPNHVIEWIRGVCEKREGVIVPVPWCEEFSFQIEDIFTRLRIVEKEKTGGMVTSKEVTSMTSIFTPHEGCEQPLIVLIEGEPGMGKTTYCQKLVFEWASKQCHEWDESFPRIDVLLFLRCREIKSTLWHAIEDQILPKGIEPEERKMFFQFLKENPSKVSIVLDGLDEADPQTLEMCLKLIQREQLRGCYIVVTSRHEVGKKVRPYTDTLLEIVGFTMTDAERYIRKYFQHKEHLAEKLISKLTVDKDLKELTQNPLNTLLLCVIFEDLEGVLPSKRSQLYVEIVLFILRRYESKNGLSNRGKDLLLVYNKELMILGETALDSLHKQELYFDDHKGDIKESLLMKFGFLSIQSGGSKRAPCDRYGFFHKSFQEFFSGYFLAFSIIDRVTPFHSVLTDPRYMGELFQVFKFMSTIIAKESVETSLSVVKRIASILNETGLTSDKLVSYLSTAHCFIIQSKTCSGDLDTKQGLKSLPEALTVNTSLSSLDLGTNSIGDDGAYSLAKALRVSTSLTSLNLCSNCIDEEGADSLAQALGENNSLSSLDISCNSIGEMGADSLAQALGVNTSLSSLNLSLNSIGTEGAISLAQALKGNASLSSLNLSGNSIAYLKPVITFGENNLLELQAIPKNFCEMD